MPFVTVQITREGTAATRQSVTRDEKAAIIKGVSQLLLDVLNKPLDSTYVVIEEVEPDNWGWGGLPVMQYRRQKQEDHLHTFQPSGDRS
ncbi:MAG: 4-oxalocrotonate tautomerase family protein [Acidocella sp.]|nr:4-oxalocrotonate tautomerase family protein [Acidocella sp.]